jgi:hypothetical protein
VNNDRIGADPAIDPHSAERCGVAAFHP